MIVFKGGRVSKGGHRTGKGSGFKGLANYLVAGPKDAESDRVAWASFRNLDTDSVAAAAGRMRDHADVLNPRVENPVYHFGVAVRPGEHLDRIQWEGVADRMLGSLGLTEHQAFVVAHSDKDHEHIHIVVNRVGPEGQAWSVYEDKIKAIATAQELELTLGLSRTGIREPASPLQILRESDRILLGDRIRLDLGEELAKATSWQELDHQLARKGYTLEPARRGSGLVVTDGRTTVSFSHVDRSLSGPQLEGRFGETFRDYLSSSPDRPQPQVATPPASAPLRERAEELIDRVTKNHATFTEGQLRRFAQGDAEPAALLAEAMCSQAIVPLGSSVQGEARLTTSEYLDQEVRLFASADTLARRSGHGLGGDQVERAIEVIAERGAVELSDEQRNAVRQATGDHDLALVLGRAGSGKTTAAEAIAEAYRAAGYEVSGGALAGKAAEGLSDAAHIPARTLAAYDAAWAEGRLELNQKSVLVIDEAGMIDTRQLGRVLEHAVAKGAKVVLIGDHDQLKAIGAGDAFRGLVYRHPPAEIGEIRRQSESWQREASMDAAAGRIGQVLQRYDQNERITWTATRAESRDAAAREYLAGDPRGSLILASTRAEVHALNQSVRAALIGSKALEANGVRVGGVEFAAGDRILFTRNDSQIGVNNGSLATLESVSKDSFTARLDSGRVVEFPRGNFSDIQHGYAVTIHKAQGITVDRAIVLADSRMDRHAAYVAFTRHRGSLRVVIDRENAPNRTALETALSRDSRKDLAADYAAAQLERAITARKEHDQALKPLLAAQVRASAARNLAERVTAADKTVATSEQALLREAARVYREPHAAAERILRDPEAETKLRAGQLEHFGELRGNQRLLLGPDQERTAALGRSQQLASEQHYHRVTLAERDNLRAYAEREAKSAPPTIDLQALTARIDHLRSTISRGPDAIAAGVVKELGHQATQAVVRLLPPQLQIPAKVLTKVIEMGLGL